MTTRDEACEAVRTTVYQAQAKNEPVTEHIVDKLIAYGIHPNAIKVAFTEEVKTNEGGADTGKT